MAASIVKHIMEDMDRVFGGHFSQGGIIIPANLDALVADEPNHQPQLKGILYPPALTEPWKPSTTVKEMLMPQAESLTKKFLILNHREIRLSPYLPHSWVDRAGTFLALGYGELAAADAYRGRILCATVITEANTVWTESDGSLASKVVNAIKSKFPRSNIDLALIIDELRVINQKAVFIMAQGLMCIRAWYDAISLLEDGLKKYPTNNYFRLLLAKLKPHFESLKKDLKTRNSGSATVQTAWKRGLVERVAYPWIAPEESARGNKAMKKLKTKFETAATNVSIAPSGLGSQSHNNYGVFAMSDIKKAERILLDISIYADSNTLDPNDCSACSQPLHGNAITVDCCDAKFCTESCKAQALNAYHKTLCGKNFRWLYAACNKATGITNEMIPLHMMKVLATAIQQNSKPLKVACVGTLKADYDKDFPSYFKLFDNIIAPTKILQTLGVDIFTDARFDPWALQTLFLRIENNKQSGNRVPNRIHGGISPLFSMLNHDCNPGATWHAVNTRGAIEVAAIRDIKKGEEVCVSYVTPLISEAKRRERIWAHIGKMCECGRCVQERETAADGGEGDAFDVSKIRKGILEAQIASQIRAGTGR